MRVLAMRTAMIGGGLAYDLRVPVEDVPHYNGTQTTTYQMSDISGQFVSFEYATINPAHFDMPKGFERYDAYLIHEKQCQSIMHKLACQAFPELEQLNELPKLWAVGLLGNKKETSKHVWLNYEKV